MKQTQTHVWSLAGEEAVSYLVAGEEAVSYLVAVGKAAAVTRERGEVAAYSLARAVSCTLDRAAPGQRENTETVAKLPQPAQPRYHAQGARPEDHVIKTFYTAPIYTPEGITIIHKICITLYTLYYYKVR